MTGDWTGVGTIGRKTRTVLCDRLDRTARPGRGIRAGLASVDSVSSLRTIALSALSRLGGIIHAYQTELLSKHPAPSSVSYSLLPATDESRADSLRIGTRLRRLHSVKAPRPPPPVGRVGPPTPRLPTQSAIHTEYPIDKGRSISGPWHRAPGLQGARPGRRLTVWKEVTA